MLTCSTKKTLSKKNELLTRRLRECDKKEAQLQEKIDSIIEELQKVAQLSVNEARDEIFARVESKMSKEIAAYIKNKEDEAKATSEEKARELIDLLLANIRKKKSKKELSRLSLYHPMR